MSGEAPQPVGRASPVKIVSVIGPTRSGSTLVARVLNEFDGVAAAGEVVSIDGAFQSCRLQGLGIRGPGAGFRLNADGASAMRRFSGLCGCGASVTDCPVWSGVEKATFGDPPDYSSWSWSASRPSGRALLSKGVHGWMRDHADGLSRIAEAVYRAFVRATGTTVVVDDSKTPLFAHFLCSQPWADVVPVRLVRDPRATAASWSRPKPYAGLEGGRFPTHRPTASAVAWMKRVVLADRLFEGRAEVLRFEDFVEDPVAAAARLVRATGVEAEPPEPTADRRIVFGENHIIAGNPDKFERGEVAIRPARDDSAVIGRRGRAVVTALTLPYLRKYGYPVV